MPVYRRLVRKVLAGLMGGTTVFLMYQATVVDSRSVAGSEPRPEPLRPIAFTATAYCKGQTTASGVAVRSGVAASDPKTLPLGSIIRIEDGPEEHRGIYTVLDTGPKVQGRQLDLYMWSCYDALAFGRRSVNVSILRRGWTPSSD